MSSEAAPRDRQVGSHQAPSDRRVCNVPIYTERPLPHCTVYICTRRHYREKLRPCSSSNVQVRKGRKGCLIRRAGRNKRQAQPTAITVSETATSMTREDSTEDCQQWKPPGKRFNNLFLPRL